VDRCELAGTTIKASIKKPLKILKKLSKRERKSMKHFKLLTASIAIGISLSGTVSAESIMHVGSWLPPTHTQNANVLPTWGKWISEATQGRVKIKIEYISGHPKSVLDQVQDGGFEAGWTYHGYFPGRFVTTQLPELPLHGISAEAASVAHWRIHEKYLAKANEHKGVIVAGLFTHGPGQIHMAKPVTSLADMKGKKIRVGGGIQGEIGKRMGIEGVPAPGSKVYEILSQGVADGVFMPMGEKKSLRLKEVAPYTVKFPGGMYLGSFGVYLNPDFMASLSEKDQQAIMAVSGEKLSRLAGAAWEANDEIGEADAIASGNQIVDANDAINAEFKTMVNGMDELWVKQASERGVDGAAALKEFREIARGL
jgi:TRAP-type C4-dicarboxylate transport system substrate-binding protein